MKASRLGIVVAAVVALGAAGVARAEEGAADTAGGFGGAAPYASVGGVLGIENNSSRLESGVNNYGGLSDSGGYDLRVGYKFEKWVAAEVEWQSLLSFSSDGVDPVNNRNLPSVEARMLSLNARVSPLDGRFQPYGLLGMGWYDVQADRTSNDLHTSSFAMRFGIGVAAYITERVGAAVEAGYILPCSGTTGGGDRFDLVPITFSFFYRFK